MHNILVHLQQGAVITAPIAVMGVMFIRQIKWQRKQLKKEEAREEE